MSLSLVLNIMGASLMLHSAFSCLHYRNLVAELELGDNDNDGVTTIPPMDVVVECMAGFFLLLMTQVTISSSTLVPVTVSSSSSKKKRELVAPAYVTRDFDIYSNRAHHLKENTILSE